MDGGVPIGFEMESNHCIESMRAAQRASEWWHCKKCDFDNPIKYSTCNGCGKPRFRKRQKRLFFGNGVGRKSIIINAEANQHQRRRKEKLINKEQQ